MRGRLLAIGGWRIGSLVKIVNKGVVVLGWRAGVRVGSSGELLVR